MKFEDLGLAPSLLRAVQAEGYHTATPIQVQAIPDVLQGRDLMGCAQTGTGKTAAFALPTLQRLSAGDDQTGQAGPGRRSGGRRAIRALVLAPTRELALQIAASFSAYGKYTGLRTAVIYGGVGQQPQVRALQAGVDIVVATPGRLLDLIGQRYVDLRKVEILILDEADQMLDMGFIHDLQQIVATVPRDRQTLMFSATMPEEIRRLAVQWLRNPAHVQVAPVATPAEQVEQTVYFVEAQQKVLLLAHLLQDTACTRTLVFVRTKRGADKVVAQLVRSGIRAAAIHSNKSQNTRQRLLDQFKSAHTSVLVATDIAARGLDVEAISHVFNYELPEVPEMYVHRIGRTGRAGTAGIAVSFCGREERHRLRLIERLTRRTIAIEQQPDYPGGGQPPINSPPVATARPAQPTAGSRVPAGRAKSARPAQSRQYTGGNRGSNRTGRGASRV